MRKFKKNNIKKRIKKFRSKYKPTSYRKKSIRKFKKTGTMFTSKNIVPKTLVTKLKGTSTDSFNFNTSARATYTLQINNILDWSPKTAE